LWTREFANSEGYVVGQPVPIDMIYSVIEQLITTGRPQHLARDGLLKIIEELLANFYDPLVITQRSWLGDEEWFILGVKWVG
jgi:hypothetical protein